MDNEVFLGLWPSVKVYWSHHIRVFMSNTMWWWTEDKFPKCIIILLLRDLTVRDPQPLRFLVLFSVFYFWRKSFWCALCCCLSHVTSFFLHQTRPVQQSHCHSPEMMLNMNTALITVFTCLLWIKGTLKKHIFTALQVWLCDFNSVNYSFLQEYHQIKVKMLIRLPVICCGA